MKLNIHIISHPVIQNLSSITSNQVLQNQTYYHLLKYLGLFIIYETIRNWMKTYQLTIKQIKDTKDIIITDPKESYVIIFNNMKYSTLVQEIQNVLPKVDIKLINQQDLNRNNKSILQLKKISQKTKFIIINNNLRLDYNMHLLDHLIYNEHINLNKIRVTCITCLHSQLIHLSKYYSQLNIYTTKIIDK